MIPTLLLITNHHNGEPEEDLLLAEYLSKSFTITLAGIREAPERLPHFSRCLIRNAWPSRQFVVEFKAIQTIAKERSIKVYNPFHRRGPIENKSYLGELYNHGFPVIPTITNVAEVSALGGASTCVIKPNDGCSSEGVAYVAATELLSRDLTNYLIQPAMRLQDEISLYFIDNAFVYATVSAGPGKRWELKEYTPNEKETACAKQFVEWNQLPFGLQRIDLCRMKDGRLFLMEIEDSMPFLSLDILSVATRERVLCVLRESLVEHIG